MGNGNEYACSDHTPGKVTKFRSIVRMHLAIVGAIRKHKYEPKGWRFPGYRFIDLTAGPGENPGNGTVSCCTAFYEEAAGLGLVDESVLYESDPGRCESLVERLGLTVPSLRTRLPEHNPTILPLDHRLCGDIPTSPANKFGLLFYDPVPNGGQFDSFRFIAEQSRRDELSKCDVLVYLAAARIKGMCKAAHCSHLIPMPLQDFMNDVGKSHWLVWEPCGGHQWTFLLGTNCGVKGWPSQGFRRVDTPQGEAVFRRLNFTQKDLHEMAPPTPYLFDVEACHE